VCVGEEGLVAHLEGLGEALDALESGARGVDPEVGEEVEEVARDSSGVEGLAGWAGGVVVGGVGDAEVELVCGAGGDDVAAVADEVDEAEGGVVLVEAVDGVLGGADEGGDFLAEDGLSAGLAAGACDGVDDVEEEGVGEVGVVGSRVVVASQEGEVRLGGDMGGEGVFGVEVVAEGA